MKVSSTVIHQPSEQEQQVYVRELNEEHMEEVVDLQQTVFEGVEQKDMLQPLTNEELTAVLGEDGLVIGVYVNQRLIAFRALLYPGVDDPENLGMDLELPASGLKRVAHQEISCVHPDYRGNRLQKRMGQWIMEAFRTNNKGMHHILCTVHPGNTASLKDKFAQGMVITHVKDKYAGILRYIMYLDINKPWKFDQSAKVRVRQNDIEKQKMLLDEGYYGIDYSDGQLIFVKQQGGKS